MTAGAATRDAEAVGVHPVFGGVMADEPQCSVAVGLYLGDVKFWLRAVDDGENGVAAFQKRRVVAGINGLMRGEPAAADHKSDAQTVGFGRLENIEGERGAEFAAINDVFSAFEIEVGLGLGGGECD